MGRFKAMEESGELDGRTLRADARKNRKNLLDVAREAFAEGGPEAPLEEIARRAGVGIGTLYRHFPSRIELIEAMYSEQIEGLIELAHRLSETKHSGEAFFSWLRAETETMISFRAIKVYLMSSDAQRRSAAHVWKDRLTEAAGLLLRNAQAAGAVRKGIDTAGVLSLVHGVITAAEASTEREKTRARQLLDVVIDGLKADTR